MSRITRVEPQAKDPGRVSLFEDETFIIGLDAGVWARSPYGVGDRLTDHDLETLGRADAEARARRDAFSYLSYKPRTAQQLRRRLTQRGFDREVAADVVNRLQAEGHVDDRAFALDWLEERLRLRPRGRHGIRAELRQRGIERETVEAVLAEHYPDESEPALTLARRRLAGRLPPEAAADPFAIVKLIGPYLARRGFAAGTIHETARRLAAAAPDDDDDRSPPPDSEEAGPP